MPDRIKELIKTITEQNLKPQVDYTTHKPTQGELNNLCYLSMKYIAGWPMRLADFAVVNQMGGQPNTVNDLDKYCEVLSEYIWDHLMGEPARPTSSEIKKACLAVRDMLYSMDKKTRNST